MKLKENILQYLNDLPNRWSANFLAFLGGVNFAFTILGALITTIYEIRPTLTITSAIEFIKYYIYAVFSYAIAYFPITCYLSVFISIFYLLLILSNKRYFVIINLIIILGFYVTFFVTNYKGYDMTQGAAIFLIFIFLANIIVVPISALIYLILLILELLTKCKIPKTLISSNSIFKKYVKFFYYYYIFLIFSMFAAGLYLIII